LKVAEGRALRARQTTEEEKKESETTTIPQVHSFVRQHDRTR